MFGIGFEPLEGLAKSRPENLFVALCESYLTAKAEVRGQSTKFLTPTA